MWACIVIFLGCGNWIFGQGIDDLAGKSGEAVLNFFSDQFNIKVSVINFENYSGISDEGAQKFYQLFASKLESSGKISYTDLMVNFHQKRGEFNLNRSYDQSHLMYIRLIRNKTAIGAGISIFSKNLDEIVFVKYVESEFVPAEQELLDTNRFGFSQTGFSRILELNAQRDLLDVRSLLNHQGQTILLFYYADKIEFFKLQEYQPVKFYTYKLTWQKPHYPSMDTEGRMSCFLDGDNFVVTVGNNFSKFSKILVFKDTKNEKWDDVSEGDIDFVPVRLVNLNNARYLAGIRYEPGKNYFEDSIVLAPFEGGIVSTDKGTYLTRQIVPFYALDISTEEKTGAMISLHVIDRDYSYRFLSSEFEQLTVEKNPRGATLCSLDGQWLATSDYAVGKDKLYFYKIENGSRRLVYENELEEEVVFISDGLWIGAPGFWVYVKKQDNSRVESKSARFAEYKLQFWSKKSESTH